MNFILRSIRDEDTDQVLDLAKQFSLLNLPANRNEIEKKMEI